MWVRTSDLGDGPEIDLELLHEIDIEFRQKKLVLYDPPKTIYKRSVAFDWIGENTGKVALGQNVIEVSGAQLWYNRIGLPQDVTVDRIERRRFVIISGIHYRPVSMSFQVTPGVANLQDLDGTETMLQGDSVIRSGVELIIDDPADYTWQSGDRLAVPPLDLRGVAKSIGARRADIRRDQESEWMRGELFDGHWNIVNYYSLGA